MVLVYILIIIFASLLLIKATDVLVFHLKELARKTALGGFFLTSLIVGLATSLPELLVGVTAALENVPNISLGNVIGSNIADLSLVAGLAAVIGGSLNIRGKSYSSDLIHAFIAGLAPLILLIDGTLSRVDGLILISLYGFYNFLILNNRKHKEEGGFIANLIRRIKRNHVSHDFMYVFLGIFLMLISADMIVRFGKMIAEDFGISILLVGLFIVAIGTSLPELVFEIKAVKKRESAMFMGNLLGSIVANGTLIIGMTALITPITIRAFSDYLMAIIFFICIFIFFFAFTKTKGRLERWEGLMLILVYLIFMIVELV